MALCPRARKPRAKPGKSDRVHAERLGQVELRRSPLRLRPQRRLLLGDTANVILTGGTGTGKTMIAQNIAQHALDRGLTVRFTKAKSMLADLSAQPTTALRDHRLRAYTSPALLVIDELGNSASDSRQTDALFDVLEVRNQHKSTVVTAQIPFERWLEVFPNATCVRAIVDRLTQYADVIDIIGKSYRLRDAKARADLQDQSL